MNLGNKGKEFSDLLGQIINEVIDHIIVEVSKRVTEGIESHYLKKDSLPVPEFKGTESETSPLLPVPEMQQDPVPPSLVKRERRGASVEGRRRIGDAKRAWWAERKRKQSISPSQEESPPSSSLPSPKNKDISSDLKLAEKEGYKGDPFYISPDGHFVGDDGFIAPKDFDEFYARYPNYIENWVKKKFKGKCSKEDVEDWRQNLIIHMKFLPPTSKYRKMGKQDVIETFNPFSQYGSSERRWRYYVNFCLTNKFNTIYSKLNKNPICRTGNLSIGSEIESGLVTDEYVYSKSEFLTAIGDHKQKNNEDVMFAESFVRYVYTHDQESFPVLEAIYHAGNASDAARSFCKTCGRLTTTQEVLNGFHEGHQIGLSLSEMTRTKSRIKKLAIKFMHGVSNDASLS